MNTIGDIPAHPFFVHFIVVLAPLTAILAILCAVWSAARERLVWLTLALAVVLTVLTPLATEAGEWLEHQQQTRTPILHEHTELGDTAIYFALGLLVVSLALAFLHRWGARLGERRGVAGVAVAVLAVLIGVASIYQIVRIGDSGARAVWGSGGS
ncbi:MULTISPECIES: DUF2231 domain-containing protein [Mycobacteriaceae]|uniref:DUF2231 domain-containing protein n=1 Tax=Mycolicibacterium mucogenicum DSM 44124 TaxID=1226753 RepID=A0A8H2PEZ9_MYCMU|nr:MULTISPECIES: DUF2231 domain-containing protein [Mycobacteriaceae]KAB7761696.1 hypothetical protein MMUC44124_03980 [Mycolicibacterium mucogenicum DSM 44124]QPG70516.1 hypothetical protein C1S78_005910 [Mycolicibacterium mucogenicum DSM 44124]